VERVVLAVLRCAVGIKMGFHGHSNALDIDPMISARAGRALRADMRVPSREMPPPGTIMCTCG
jgi:hypothetical protein